MLGCAGQTQVVVFPGTLCPVLPGKGQLAGQAGGGALLGCPRSSLWPLQAGGYRGGGVTLWLSHLSTPWDGRQGLGREVSPKEAPPPRFRGCCWPSDFLCFNRATLQPSSTLPPSLPPLLICTVPGLD